MTPRSRRSSLPKPDAIFYAGYEVEAPYLRAALVQAGVTVPFLASDGAFLAATIDEAGGAAEGIYVSSFAPSPKTVADAAWIKDYQAVEYRNPDTYSINGYSALEVLAEGVKKAGSFNSVQVANAIRALPGVETPMGSLSYNEAGDLRQPDDLYLPGSERRLGPGLSQALIGTRYHLAKRSLHRAASFSSQGTAISVRVTSSPPPSRGRRLPVAPSYKACYQAIGPRRQIGRQVDGVRVLYRHVRRPERCGPSPIHRWPIPLGHCLTGSIPQVEKDGVIGVQELL